LQNPPQVHPTSHTTSKWQNRIRQPQSQELAVLLPRRKKHLAQGTMQETQLL